jgi:hypothetical protein
MSARTGRQFLDGPTPWPRCSTGRTIIQPTVDHHVDRTRAYALVDGILAAGRAGR